jgi:hypothetical protein
MAVSRRHVPTPLERPHAGWRFLLSRDVIYPMTQRNTTLNRCADCTTLTYFFRFDVDA